MHDQISHGRTRAAGAVGDGLEPLEMTERTIADVRVRYWYASVHAGGKRSVLRRHVEIFDEPTRAFQVHASLSTCV